MSYLRISDRPIEVEVFPVITRDDASSLWAARLPGGRIYCHGETQKLALDGAYNNLTAWRSHNYEPYEGQDLDSEYVRSRLALNSSRRKIQNLVRVVRGPGRKITGQLLETLIREKPPHSLVYVGENVPGRLKRVYAMPSLEGYKNGMRVYGLRSRGDIPHVVALLSVLSQNEPIRTGDITYRTDGREFRYREIKNKK